MRYSYFEPSFIKHLKYTRVRQSFHALARVIQTILSHTSTTCIQKLIGER